MRRKRASGLLPGHLASFEFQPELRPSTRELGHAGNGEEAPQERRRTGDVRPIDLIPAEGVEIYTKLLDVDIPVRRIGPALQRQN